MEENNFLKVKIKSKHSKQPTNHIPLQTGVWKEGKPRKTLLGSYCHGQPKRWDLNFGIETTRCTEGCGNRLSHGTCLVVPDITGISFSTFY